MNSTKRVSNGLVALRTWNVFMPPPHHAPHHSDKEKYLRSFCFIASSSISLFSSSSSSSSSYVQESAASAWKKKVCNPSFTCELLYIIILWMKFFSLYVTLDVEMMLRCTNTLVRLWDLNSCAHSFIHVPLKLSLFAMNWRRIFVESKHEGDCNRRIEKKIQFKCHGKVLNWASIRGIGRRLSFGNLRGSEFL